MMRKTRLKVVGDNDTALLKKEIQDLVRFICCYRDGGCILRGLRHCGGEAMVDIIGGKRKIIGFNVIQADHLITRANSATFADTRLIVCLCKGCHMWKKYHKEEYDDLVKTILPWDRVLLWEKCEEDMHAHKTYKLDLSMAIVALVQELKKYELEN